MTRNAEAVLLAAAAGLAAFGVTLVNLAGEGTVDAQVALTFLVFGIAFGAVHLATRRWAANGTTVIWPLVAGLTAVGFSEIYRLAPERAGLQRWWILIGALLAVVFAWWLERNGTAVLRRYRYTVLVFSIMLLLLPLIPLEGALPLRGKVVNGSRLWVEFDLGFIEMQFQPGEMVKLLLVVFLASYLSDQQAALTAMTRTWRNLKLPEPRQLVPIAVAFAASFLVLAYQRDLGAAVLLFAAFVGMLYAATGQLSYLAAGGFLGAAGAIGGWLSFSHVQGRLDAWLRPFDFYETAGYQIAQGLFAMGSGSLSGAGLGLGRPDTIPFAETDFIFAAAAEELGMAGSIAIISGFALLVAVGFGIALRSRDPFRKLLAAGLTLVLGTQTILIIGGVVRLFPLTGITLPFMSYGGSSLVVNFLVMTLLVRISHEERV